MTVTKLPATVSPGAPAGYQIHIVNNGPSNISQLYLTADIGNTPVYLTTSQGTCNASGALFCSFGAVNDDATVDVTVAFTTPGSGTGFNVKFQLNTGGFTFSDTKDRSHGDLLTKAVSTALNNGKNFAGFFSTDAVNGIGNNDQLNGNNKQSTRIGGLAAGFDGSVSDGSVTPDACTTDLAAGIDCTRIDGETSVVSVDGGLTIPGGFFIVIHNKNGSTPIAYVHRLDSGNQQKINQCAGNVAPAVIGATPCFTWDAATTTATIYTQSNGSYTKLH